MKKELAKEFVDFVKEHYGVTLTAVESCAGEHFVDLYGYDTDDVTTHPLYYANSKESFDLPVAAYDKDFILAA